MAATNNDSGNGNGNNEGKPAVREDEMTTREKLEETAQQAETLESHLLNHYKSTYSTEGIKQSLRDALAASPLIAALVAPLSTLYDIPALTQRWYTLNGTGATDPMGNLALSATGLAFNAIANGFLVFRFSAGTKWRKTSVIVSTVCWVIKMILAIVNLGVYGAGSRNGPGYRYAEGFWCAVLSAILASFIAVILVIYAFFAKASHWSDNRKIQVQGRHFVLSELALFCFIAVWALIFSRIEDWDYFSAIYFCVVTTLTVGFGDFEPTHTSTRILTFPFALISIAALATQVGEIVGYFGARAQDRKTRWRALYEKREETEYHKLHPTDELIAEMEFLQRIVRQENAASRTYDLILSLFCFAIFWFIGALAFSYIEDWDYGTALYFSYVFFLTIGYGDESPSQPAGKVFFVIYALIAVPVVASFAIQTVSGIWQASQERRLEKNKVKRGLEPKLDRHATINISMEDAQAQKQYAAEHGYDEEVDEEMSINPFVSHMELVVQGHEAYKVTTDKEGDVSVQDVGKVEKKTVHEMRRARRSTMDSNASKADKAIAYGAIDPGQAGGDKSAADGTRSRTTSGNSDGDAAKQEEGHRAEERKQLDELLMYATRLEDQARKLIIDKLEPGSRPRLLLQADKNVMERTVDFFEGNKKAAAETTVPVGPLNDLEEIHIYRETYARMLVAATRLKRLQGQDQLRFERRRGYPYYHGQPVEGEDYGVPEPETDTGKLKKKGLNMHKTV